MTSSHHRPAGSLADPDHQLRLTPEVAGWTYSGLAVVQLAPGASHQVSTGQDEMVVLPLEGGCTVTADSHTLVLQGRPSVFHGPSDFAYLPLDTQATITSPQGGRIALPSARARRRLTVAYGPVQDIPIELRGAGQMSRQIRNFCGPDSFEADNLIAVEVITPGGNWSSFPPHKHDELSAQEVPLEEVYYFQVAPGPQGPGMAYQRVYGSPGKSIDVLAEVRSGDVVLIPHGYHGPSMATPGYDLYYLNVMAGPTDERAWRICDDPAHAWVRQTWVDQPIDARLLGGGGGW